MGNSATSFVRLISLRELSGKTKENVKEELEPEPPTALTNHLVIRHILSYLPLDELKKCRLVSRFWCFEVGFVIRQCHECNVHISDEHQCSDLLALNELLSQMTVPPIINSLTLGLFQCEHPDCESVKNETRAHGGELVKRLPLKHVDIYGDYNFGPEKCPANEFVVTLLREGLSELETLAYDYFPEEIFGEFAHLFVRDWEPVLPKLKVLTLRKRWFVYEEFFLEILNAAPNLQKIKGYWLCPYITEVLEEEEYDLIDEFRLSIHCEQEEEACKKLVEYGRGLSALVLCAPSGTENHFKSTFLLVANQLLTRSSNTLEELTMERQNITFSSLNFPSMEKLKTLTIITEGRPHEIFMVLRSIDYAKLLPALVEVKIERIVDNFPPNPWISDDDDPEVLRPSNTVKKLEIQGHLVKIQCLSEIFPKLSSLELRVLWHGAAVEYADLWACWPLLETIELIEHADVLTKNFDAEFLGINAEEVSALRELDEESLEKIHIVPIRHSVLTMSRLQRLKIDFTWGDLEAEVAPDQVFLSKLTGILAFNKMKNMAITVQLCGWDTKIASRLNHLLPFASVDCSE